MHLSVGRALARLSLALTFVLVLNFGAAAIARPDGDRERAAAGLEAAIAALGGPKYLAIKSAVARGVFTSFNQGQATFPVDFVDTFVYPDRNRTDFGKKKSRVVQSNTKDGGWKYDGARETLTAQDADEVHQFALYVRANIDNILRGGWRAEGVQLHYIGRTDIAPRVWAEGVSVEYPDGFKVDLFFDPQTHLPVASRYHIGAESGAAGSLVETRYHVFLDFDGVKVPRTVDLYKDQVQTARLVYDTVDFNTPIDPKFFDQPASAKALK